MIDRMIRTRVLEPIPKYNGIESIKLGTRRLLKTVQGLLQSTYKLFTTSNNISRGQIHVYFLLKISMKEDILYIKLV
jgi:hypothetical protein